MDDNNDPVRATEHAVTRFSIDVGQPYEAFRRRFEAAIAPVGLRVFWRSEHDGEWDATSYLVGNPVVASGMSRADPAVMSVVPFHLAITVGHDGATRLTFDQPSTHLASFEGEAFAAAAPKVDAKFATLLEACGAPVPEQLRPA